MVKVVAKTDKKAGAKAGAKGAKAAKPKGGVTAAVLRKGRAKVAKGTVPRKARAFRGTEHHKGKSAGAAFVVPVAVQKERAAKKQAGIALETALKAKIAAKIAANPDYKQKKPRPKFHATVVARNKVQKALKKKGVAQVKALATEKAAAKGHVTKRKTFRLHASFHRPHTLRLHRKPRYARHSVARSNKMDEFRVVKHPLTSETAIKKIEDSNTLVFICDVRANKVQIAKSVEKLYKIRPERVNTLITPLGEKKAFVKLAKSADALEVASSIGIL